MKVLAIMGSPRKNGESYKLTRQFEVKLKQLGEVDFEYFFLRDANLGQCVGCHICIHTSEEKCPLKDERAQIEQAMLSADGVIFVSSVYTQHVTGLMKTFLDRFSFAWHRPRFFHKKAMAIATGGGMFKETLGYMKTNAKNIGFDWATGLGVPHPESLRPKYRAKAERSIERAAQRFYRALTERRTRVPGVGDLIWFRMWRLNASVCRESNPCDYAYWKDHNWFIGDYYYPVRTGIPNRIVANMVGALIRRFMHSMYEGY